MRKKISKISVPSERKRYRRKLTIRKKIIGTAAKPRLCVVKSNRHLSAQLIDDNAGVTLLAATTFGKNKVGDGCNRKSAEEIGAALAEKLKAKGISAVVFDRNGRSYTGIIANFADAVRKNGIIF